MPRTRIPFEELGRAVQFRNMTNKRKSALVLVGHGSTLNPDSSAPTFQHADEIIRRGLFAEVHCCFWKEEPSLREILRMVESDDIYVVPNFISEGYFTRQSSLENLNLSVQSPVDQGKLLNIASRSETILA